jgi:hypothetical protein
MVSPLRKERPVPPLSPAKIQLMLRTPDGSRWAVTLSDGMARFIGRYSRVPGLGSDRRLLQYRQVGLATDPAQPAAAP